MESRKYGFATRGREHERGISYEPCIEKALSLFVKAQVSAEL